MATKEKKAAQSPQSLELAMGAVARLAVMRERERLLGLLLNEDNAGLAAQMALGEDAGNELAVSAARAGANMALRGVAEHLRATPPPASVLPNIVAGRVRAVCAEIGREVALRRKVYPAWVANGRLKGEDAEKQIELMEEAAALLRDLSGVER